MEHLCPKCGKPFTALVELVHHMASCKGEQATMTTTHPICPRCQGYIPNNDRPGAYPGALSRLDNKTEICSDCGVEEALEEFSRDGITDWRITAK